MTTLRGGIKVCANPKSGIGKNSLVKEGLIISDLPAAQGCAAKINRDKRLILCKKRKPHFPFFSL